MPIYQVEAPDGKILEVEGPENARQDQIVSYAISNYLGTQQKPVEAPAPAPEPEQGDFMRGLKGWLPGFQETLGGAQVLAGKAVGSEGIMQSGMERMKTAQAAQKAKATDEFTNAWEQGIGTVLTDWLPYQLGAGVGNIAESVAFAGIGSLLGGTLGGGVGAAPGAAVGFLEKTLVKEGVKKAAKEIMETEGKEAAAAYVAKMAAGEIEKDAAKVLARQGGKYYGSIAGTIGQAGLHGAGEPTSRALQEAGFDPSQLDMSKLLPAVGVHSVADFISERILLGGFKGMAGIPEKSTNKFVYDVLKGATVTGAKEIPPEVLQSVAERYGAKLSVDDAEAGAEYLNTAAAAFAMSMIPGGVGGARTYAGRTTTPAPATPPEATPETVTTPEGATITPEQAEYGPSEGPSIRELEREQPPVGAPVQEAGIPEQQPVAEPNATEAEQQPWVGSPQAVKLYRGYREGSTPGYNQAGAIWMTRHMPTAQAYADFENDLGRLEERTVELKKPFIFNDNTAHQMASYFVDKNKDAAQHKELTEFFQEFGLARLEEQAIKKLREDGFDSIIVQREAGAGAHPAGEESVVLLPETTKAEAEPLPAEEALPTAEQPAKPLPPTVHPLESWAEDGVKDAEAIRQKATQAANNAGINVRYGVNKIDPERTRVDWDRISQFPTVGGLLNHIQPHVPVDYAEIIKKILPSVQNIPLNVVNKLSGSPRALGAYRPSIVKATGDVVAHRIELSTANNGNDISTIVHEALHGATVSNYYRGKNGDERYAQAAKDLDSLARKLRKLHNEGKAKFSFMDSYKVNQIPRELISWGQTDREVQAELKKIVMPNKKTAWSEFVTTMRKLLGLPANQTTALEHLLDISERLTSQRDVMERKPAGKTIEETDTLAETFAKEKPEVVGPPERQVEYGRQNILGEPVRVPVREAFSMGEPDKSWWSSFTHNFVHDYVDKYIDLKKLIAAINATAKKLDPKWDAYMRETLYHGRVASQTSMFLKNELDPLVKDMVARGVSEEELNAYLMARHAQEYNKVIGDRNPDNALMQHRGSGIHDMIAEAYMRGATKQEIEAIKNAMESQGLVFTKSEQALIDNIDKLTPAKRKALEEVAKRVDSIVRKTQRIAVAGGIETQETIDYWNDMYKHYVPFKRSPEELEFAQYLQGTGRGFSASAKMGRASTGSLKTIDNVLSNIILQRDMAIVKSEKARVGRAIYAMALEHPNPDIYLAVNPNAGVIGKANDALIKLAKDQNKLKGLNEAIDNRRNAGQDYAALAAEAEKLSQKIAADRAKYIRLAAEAKRATASIIEEMRKFGYDSQGQNLDPDRIESIIREPQGAFYNENTGLVEYRTNSFLRNSPNVLAVPVDGETRYVFFNAGNEQAMRLAMALKGADVEQLGKITAVVSKFTRWIAQVNTQYNPFFGIINMLRDVQGAQFNLSSTPLAGQQMAVNANIYPAIRTIWQSMRSGEPSGPFALQWNEFVRRGGMTGIRDMLVNIKKGESVLSDMIAEYNRNPSEAAFRKTTKSVFQFMSDFNDTMENAVRLAAFIEAKKKFSKQYANPDVAADKAAELAKNLTVNFNRKGAKTQLVNSWYAFFNASIQGSARLIETMNGPAGKKIAASLVLLGVIQQLMLSGFDDDDPPEFVREKNLVIPTGDGKYISWPMPLGFNLLVNTGRLATSTFMGGGDNIAKNVSNMFSVAASSFNPLGGESLVQTAAPTVLDPAVSLYGNVDAFGRPIYRADRPGKPVPGYLRSTEGSTEFSRQIAKALNYMSGGTEFQKGEISPTADHIDYLAGQIGGGTFREARKVGEFISNQITGEETAPYRVPLAGRFMGDTGSEANVRNKFYQNIQTMAAYEAEIKGRMKQGTAGEFLKEHPEARFYQAANTVENQINQMNKMRKQLIERGASKEQLKQLNDRKIEVMRQFNDQYERATK